MKYMSIFWVPFLTAILIQCFWRVIRNKARKKESKMNMRDFVICYSPRCTIFMMLVSAGLLISLVILNIKDMSNLFIDIIVSAMVVLSSFGAYSTSRESISVKNSCITYTPVLGKTVHYQFSDIKKIKCVCYSNGMVLYKVYSDRHIFTVDPTNAGAYLFLKRAEQFGIIVE